jgi:hypothetical protein
MVVLRRGDVCWGWQEGVRLSSARGDVWINYTPRMKPRPAHRHSSVLFDRPPHATAAAGGGGGASFCLLLLSQAFPDPPVPSTQLCNRQHTHARSEAVAVVAFRVRRGQQCVRCRAPLAAEGSGSMPALAGAAGAAAAHNPAAAAAHINGTDDSSSGLAEANGGAPRGRAARCCSQPWQACWRCRWWWVPSTSCLMRRAGPRQSGTSTGSTTPSTQVGAVLWVAWVLRVCVCGRCCCGALLAATGLQVVCGCVGVPKADPQDGPHTR